jgi:hypothetical protein
MACRSLPAQLKSMKRPVPLRKNQYSVARRFLRPLRGTYRRLDRGSARTTRRVLRTGILARAPTSPAAGRSPDKGAFSRNRCGSALSRFLTISAAADRIRAAFSRKARLSSRVCAVGADINYCHAFPFQTRLRPGQTGIWFLPEANGEAGSQGLPRRRSARRTSLRCDPARGTP